MIPYLTNRECDLVVRGGTVVDGTGGPPIAADVAIQDGRIRDVGQFVTEPDIPSLDAAGCLVTPGFIDVHSHSDLTLLLDPRAISSITQGVTLEVIGNCGHGCAPVADPETVKGNVYGWREGFRIDWKSTGEYLARLSDVRPAVNVAALVPNGNLRLAVAGMVDRPSTPDEVRRMKSLLTQGLEEGAFGYSTGLEYAPERGCSEEEITELCRVVARAGAFYATHTRNRAGAAQETIAEALRTGARSGVSLQVSHIGVVSRLADDGRWAVDQSLEQVDSARRSGQDVTFDMHTRLFGTTNLSAALPPWALAGGKAGLAALLRDPSARERLKAHQSIVTALARGGWDRIVLGDSTCQPELSRKSIGEISAARGVESLDAVYDILLGEIDDVHGLMILAFTYREDDLRAAFEHPCCMVGSDATALAPDGPLQGATFHGAYTWAAWFFRHFVRDHAAFSATEAVRRLTSLPASRLGLKDRGIVRAGAWADLAVFDPATFAERGTTFEPNRIAAGMRHVVVNGRIALENGAVTSTRAGQVLRRV